jgi:hypothetical protein
MTHVLDLTLVQLDPAQPLGLKYIGTMSYRQEGAPAGSVGTAAV